MKALTHQKLKNALNVVHPFLGSVANSEIGKIHTGLHPVPGEKIPVKRLIFI